MTNEEAIVVLQKIKPIPHRGDSKSTTHILETIALDMAIKALEQQPCEDCISREQAIKQCGFGMTSLLIADYLRKLPSVTPKAEQKAVLDKIKAEIEQLTSRYSISKERGGMGIVEWSDRLIEESDVLQIIDKYKAESEEEE